MISNKTIAYIKSICEYALILGVSVILIVLMGAIYGALVHGVIEPMEELLRAVVVVLSVFAPPIVLLEYVEWQRRQKKGRGWATMQPMNLSAWCTKKYGESQCPQVCMSGSEFGGDFLVCRHIYFKPQVTRRVGEMPKHKPPATVKPSR